MKYTKHISNISVFLLLLAFFAGSTGITLILHNCPECGDFNIKSGLYLSPTEPEDHCCGYADHHSESKGSQELISSECHYKIDKLKFDNYTSEEPVLLSPLAILTVNINTSPENYSPGNITSLYSNVYNKHGGRFTVTNNCQFIS